MEEIAHARSPGDIFPLLDLTAELRNNIYRYAADWNDIQHRRRQRGPARSGRIDGPWFSTPTILLLNRQITLEGTDVIGQIPLRIYQTDFGKRMHQSPAHWFISFETIRFVSQLRTAHWRPS